MPGLIAERSDQAVTFTHNPPTGSGLPRLLQPEKSFRFQARPGVRLTQDRSMGQIILDTHVLDSSNWPVIFGGDYVEAGPNEIKGILIEVTGTPSPQIDNHNVFYVTETQFVKYQILDELYRKELSSMNLTNCPADSIFDATAIELSKIDSISSAVEITPGGALKFTFTLGGGKVLMVSKTIDQFDDNETVDAIVFSIFINRKLIVSDVAEIKEFVKGINKYLSL